ncbi:MAG: hypothetical protein LBQ20_05605 [Rhodanobacter sp.]|jgi:hypothetical protein|nr:hypothetical protein [Rhodanobacter sp.]
MKSTHFIVSAVLILVAAAQAIAQGTYTAQDDGYNQVTIRPSDIPSDAPQLEFYPVSIYKGANALPRLNSDTETRMFRTRIKAWSKIKSNFAGHYILATWGCGSDCLQITIIDAKTGKIFHPNGVTYNVSTNVHAALLESGLNWHGEGSVKFQVDSELLILFGMPEEDTNRRGISYYIWRKNKLSLVRFVPKAWYGDEYVNTLSQPCVQHLQAPPCLQAINFLGFIAQR